MIEYNNREDFILQHNSCYDNTWVTACYCSNCGVLSNPEETTFNFYKVRDLYYCGPCYSEIGKRHAAAAVHGGGVNNWSAEGELYWHGDSSDLQ